MDLTAAVYELYGVAPADFVATRTRLVQTAKGDDPDLAAQVKALRKPTQSAWLLNRVARDEPQVVADLTALGERMRTAQSRGDGAALAAARPERRAAIDALVAAAGRCAEAAGARLSPTGADEVEATAVAALADEQSGRALRSGSLLRPLSYAGFGEVELDDAVATPLRLLPPLPDDAPEEPTAPDETERALTQARDDLREAERELSAARLDESRLRSELVAARDRTTTAEARVTSVTHIITDLETRRAR
ncbi:hypothetical protein NMQ01_14455 [Janibacter sp. CX7]|uniref:hypothetical protein n=1 Tax=Janibacter sp. CX7 TaxID=2963431 RepID=UPI0020CC4630|nr:hypothetical protein [Janibacter sp. CX7]UTT65880.1 hypothetical protein NMQ01_14455 [Janibacter sp. CX7]